MLEHFSWMDIISITGWPLWIVLACNTLLITLIFERLWYLWKPLQMYLHRKKRKKSIRSFTQKKWEYLFFQEQQRVHIGLPLARNLIIICPMAGLLASLINFVQLIQAYGFTPFYMQSMHTYICIRLLVPMGAGIASALLGIIALRLYVKYIQYVIHQYPSLFRKNP